MNLKHDNVFYHMYSSIRYDWTNGVKERGEWLLEILPFTSVIDKNGMKDLLETMISSCQRSEYFFDGRDWVRDCSFNYLKVDKWISNLNDIDLIYDEGEYYPYLNENDNMYEDVEVLYEEWKKLNTPANQ